MTRRRWILWGIALSILGGAFVLQGDMVPGVAFLISATAAFAESTSKKYGRNPE